MKNPNWKSASVGCYWSKDQFSICTQVTFTNGIPDFTYPSSGYLLTILGQEIGLYKTRKAAQEAAERHRGL